MTLMQTAAWLGLAGYSFLSFCGVEMQRCS